MIMLEGAKATTETVDTLRTGASAMKSIQISLYQDPVCMMIVFLKELWPDVKDSNLFQAPLYWDLYAPRGLNTARICFTCHNFEYQGTTPASELASCGIDVHQLSRHDRMQENASHDRVNPIKVIDFNGSFELRKRHQGEMCFTCSHSLGCDRVLQHSNNSISIFLSLPRLSLYVSALILLKNMITWGLKWLSLFR
ncbi:uncharacterized protein LOC131224187 [Magnolia sinica]|uniref:uncharacterized protein LOC131224187 n=1 Tax=Magnolia sinica TaxID=86752 RepID=UPI00265B3946|nr:uncharacterized protein LOC131224187 [Magnolia sinica]